MRKSAVPNRLEDAQDLEKLNGASGELNAESADVLEYQAVDEDLDEHPNAEENLQ